MTTPPCKDPAKSNHRLDIYDNLLAAGIGADVAQFGPIWASDYSLQCSIIDFGSKSL
jgi:hypothetical protein